MRIFVTIGVDVEDNDTAHEFEWYIRRECIPNFVRGEIDDAVVSMIR